MQQTIPLLLNSPKTRTTVRGTANHNVFVTDGLGGSIQQLSRTVLHFSDFGLRLGLASHCLVLGLASNDLIPVK